MLMGLDKWDLSQQIPLSSLKSKSLILMEVTARQDDADKCGINFVSAKMQRRKYEWN
jgi:hypothetical protein